MLNIPSHLRPAELPHAEDRRAVYFHVPDPKTTLDDVLNPEYWSNISERLKVGDLIEVRAADFSFDTVLRVVAKDPQGHWAQVTQRGKLPATGVLSGGATDASGLRHEKDPVKGWRVMRGKEELAVHLPDEAAAIAKRNEFAARPARRA